MTQDSRPLILLIDDLPHEVRSLEQLLKANAESVALHPDDVTDADIAGSNLVLIDFRLENWPGRSDVEQISLKPQDGLALAAVLRSRMREVASASAIALHSGHLEDIVPFSPSRRPQVIARAANIEWAFPKSSETRGRVASIVSLARAAIAASEIDLGRDQSRVLSQLLVPPANAPWLREGIKDAESCLPPAYELLDAFGGLALVRWLLHRILPYPCFLWDVRRVALRLRTTVGWVKRHTASGGGFADWLGAARYTGALDSFLGERWWRAGIEQQVWELTDGAAFSVEALHAALAELAGETPTALAFAEPSLALGPDLEPLDEFIAFDEAVRVQPDDWPAFAEPALMAAAAAEETPMARLVVASDRWKLR